MYRDCKKFWTKVIFIAVLLLFFYLPLKADENESKMNLAGNEDSKAENKTVDLNPSPSEKQSSINLESFQLTEKGIKPYKIRLDFSPKQIDVNLVSHEFLKKPKNPPSILYTSSLITLTLLNIADYYTTVTALKYDGLKESNPVMRPFTKNTLLYTTVKVGLTAYNYYFLNSLYKNNKTLAWAVSLVANFALSYVVANNIRNIQEAQNN